jgi:hypothetical protein
VVRIVRIGRAGVSAPVPPAELLVRLADRVRRLSPCHRDPHRFHEDKSDIEAELRRLARAPAKVAQQSDPKPRKVA